jgi:hypothetical protein
MSGSNKTIVKAFDCENFVDASMCCCCNPLLQYMSHCLWHRPIRPQSFFQSNWFAVVASVQKRDVVPSSFLQSNGLLSLSFPSVLKRDVVPSNQMDCCCCPSVQQRVECCDRGKRADAGEKQRRRAGRDIMVPERIFCRRICAPKRMLFGEQISR